MIFHLRELAKASVMAKYLVDAKIAVDPRWSLGAIYYDTYTYVFCVMIGPVTCTT